MVGHRMLLTAGIAFDGASHRAIVAAHRVSVVALLCRRIEHAISTTAGASAARRSPRASNTAHPTGVGATGVGSTTAVRTATISPCAYVHSPGCRTSPNNRQTSHPGSPASPDSGTSSTIGIGAKERSATVEQTRRGDQSQAESNERMTHSSKGNTLRTRLTRSAHRKYISAVWARWMRGPLSVSDQSTVTKLGAPSQS